MLAVALFACASGISTPSTALQCDDIRSSEGLVVLASRGSFFVGGETVDRTAVEIGSLGPDDRITVDQMYFEYIVPERATKVPVVMVHGATLSGKMYDTTPDGRMGWHDYSVRRSHYVQVVDLIGRARSGFNSSAFNNERAGRLPAGEQAEAPRDASPRRVSA